jgi:hypothetical protein
MVPNVYAHAAQAAGAVAGVLEMTPLISTQRLADPAAAGGKKEFRAEGGR